MAFYINYIIPLLAVLSFIKVTKAYFEKKVVPFSYDDKEWGKDYPMCNGMSQSPINIDLSKIEMVLINKPLQLIGYENVPTSLNLTNNGYTVILTGEWADGKKPRLTGGTLDEDYLFGQLHFHWGKDDSEGGEHQINNQGFPIEMHVVHYKEHYGSVEAALADENGILVMGYFFMISTIANPGIDKIGDHLPEIKKYQDSVSIEPFPINMFALDLEGIGYFSYMGSLTVPPCTENVKWLIPISIKNITTEELLHFRKLSLEMGENHNWRHLQAINNRKVEYNFEFE